MPGDDLLYPPAQYGAGWLLLVLAIVVLAILAAVLVTRLTRPRKPAAEPAADPAAVVSQLRLEYLAAIDDIDARVVSGQLDARHAHLELSRLMRAFANEYSGIEAPVMTLRDLVAAGVNPALVDALGRYTYPSVFRREDPIDPRLGAEAARQVVRTWR